MIRVAFVTQAIYAPTGGSEKQLLQLLGLIDRTQFEPVLCVLRPTEWLLRDFDACPLRLLGIGSLSNPSAWYGTAKFARFLRRADVQVLYAFSQDGFKVGVLAAKLAGTPAILAARRNQGYWLSRLELIQMKALDRWVDVFITNSKSTVDYIHDVEGVPPERIEVIHNGLDLSLYDEDGGLSRHQVREELGVSEEVPVVGIVANLRPVKALDVFLRAASRVRRKYDPARFIIIGKDFGEGARLQSVAQAEGLTEHVLFLGERSDIPRLLRALDVGVISSSSESFSNSLAEYLAAGLPVVSTDVGGANEAIQDGVSGYVVPVGDSDLMADRICRLIERGPRAEVRDACLARARELFDLRQTVRMTERIILRHALKRQAANARLDSAKHP